MITPPSRYDRLSATALAIGPTAFGSACASTMRVGDAPFSTHHLDVGRAQLVDHRRARHAHHLRDDHAAQRQHRHRERAQQLRRASRMSDAYESAGSQRSCTAKTSTASVATRNSGTDTIGHRADAERAVEPRAAVHRRRGCRAPARSAPRHGGDRRQQQRVRQAAADQLGAPAVAWPIDCPGCPCSRPAEPVHVAHRRRHVEPHLRAQRGQRLRASLPGRAAPAPRRRAAAR